MKLDGETDTVTPGRKTRNRGKLLGLVILLSGMILGFCVALMILLINPFLFMRPPKPKPGDIIERMDRDLDLTDEQEDKLREIFRTRHEELDFQMKRQFEKTEFIV